MATSAVRLLPSMNGCVSAMPVRQHGRLKCEIGLSVVRVVSGASERAFEGFAAPQVICGLRRGRVDDRGVDLEGVLEDENNGLPDTPPLVIHGLRV
jgi:hypothetical protein